METQTVSSPGSSATAWTPMQTHVRTYLAGHPLVRGFGVGISADEAGITAELRGTRQSLRARHSCSGWWKPSTPQHGREIADQLARDLYARWMDQLRSG